MSADQKKPVITSIKIYQSTARRAKEFVDGTGGTYTEAIEFLLDQIAEEKETALLSGVRLRSAFQQWRKDRDRK